jgi:hypothetical protein
VDLQQLITKDLHLLHEEADIVAAASNESSEVESNVSHDIAGLRRMGIVDTKVGDASPDVLHKFVKETEIAVGCGRRGQAARESRFLKDVPSFARVISSAAGCPHSKRDAGVMSKEIEVVHVDEHTGGASKPDAFAGTRGKRVGLCIRTRGQIEIGNVGIGEAYSSGALSFVVLTDSGQTKSKTCDGEIHTRDLLPFPLTSASSICGSRGLNREERKTRGGAHLDVFVRSAGVLVVLIFLRSRGRDSRGGSLFFI